MVMRNPTCIMLCGLPTSGKSTYVKILKSLPIWHDAIVLSTDSYIEQEAKRLGLTYGEVFDEAIDEATRRMDMEFNMAKERGQSIIWDQTNLSSKSRMKKLLLLPNNYIRVGVLLEVKLEEALRRNEKRYKENGKYVPKSVLKRMSSQLEAPTSSEGFDVIFSYDISEIFNEKT